MLMVPNFDEIDNTLHDLLGKLENFNGERVQSQFDVQMQVLTSLESDAENVRQECSVKEENTLKKTKKVEIQTDECRSAKNENKQLQKAYEKVKKEITALSDDPLTENDQQILKKTKKKFFMYEQCTGVVFDYSHKETVKGFVRNVKTDYVNTFSFEKNPSVEAALWTEISKAGELQCSQHTSQLKGKLRTKKV